MTALLSWMPLDFGRDLGWTLIHFLRQGVLLAALLYAILPICRSAIARHNCALAILVLMALAPVATFLSIHDFAKSGGAALSDGGGPIASASLFAPGWLVVLWLAGVAVLSLRGLGCWYLAGALWRRGTLAV